MVVNGETYNSIMPPQPVNDEEIRDVMNYILNSWGNNGGEVTLEEVKAQRQ
jgi:nitrite reductase (NO-forming)